MEKDILCSSETKPNIVAAKPVLTAIELAKDVELDTDDWYRKVAAELVLLKLNGGKGANQLPMSDMYFAYEASS